MYRIHKDNEVQVIHAPRIKQSGEVRIVVKDLMGNEVHDTGYIKNSFTTYGDEHSYSTISGIDIGEGGAATTAGMTDLVTPLTDFGRPSGVYAATWNEPTAPTWEIWSEAFRQFGPGGAAWRTGFTSGTIREVGLFKEWNPRGPDLMCRQVVADIPITADNIVFAYYRLNGSVPSAVTTGQVVIDGVTYNTSVGFCAVMDAQDMFNGIYPSLPSSETQTCPAVNHDVLAGFADYPIRSEAEIGNAYTDLAHSSGRTVLDSVAVDIPNRWVDWTQQFQLNYGNFPVRGVMGVYNALRYNRLSGQRFSVGCTFTAVDGPNPGEGIPKDNTQWLNIYWRIGYGGVITV